jgi:hypothetical protein
LIQTGVVALLVFYAAAYSLWYVLPSGIRKRLGGLHKGLAQGPACQSCSDCGMCAGTSKSENSTAALTQLHPITFHKKSQDVQRLL